MKKLMLLFSFMTRLPVPKKARTEFDAEELGKSMKFFPIIGLVIGLILYLFARGISFVTDPAFPFLLSVLILLLEVTITGALHLDGLADTFDGDRKSTRLNSSHANISYAVFCLKKKKNITA